VYVAGVSPLFCGLIIGGIHQWNVQFCDVPRLLILGFIKKV
jgi:hypothetical protein